jgi:hypothetical protein
MIESLAEKMQRRGFPIGILITRDGPYGATSSRNLYADELTPEELADHKSKGLGYPLPVEIPRLSNPQSAFQDSPAPISDSPSFESSNQPQASASPQVPEREANSSPGESAEIRQPEQIFESSVLAKTNISHDVLASGLPPDFSRHARRCAVCAHPDRDAIEGDFIRWASPAAIARSYKIADRASIYRHAHSTGLFNRRKHEVGRVLETVLENVEQCPIESFDTIIRAARLYTHLDDRGNWTEPPRITYFISGPPPHLASSKPKPRAQRKTRGAKALRLLTATQPSSKKRPRS